MISDAIAISIRVAGVSYAVLISVLLSRVRHVWTVIALAVRFGTREALVRVAVEISVRSTNSAVACPPSLEVLREV